MRFALHLRQTQQSLNLVISKIKMLPDNSNKKLSDKHRPDTRPDSSIKYEILKHSLNSELSCTSVEEIGGHIQLLNLFMHRDRIVCRENQGRKTVERIGIKKACMVNKGCLLVNSGCLPNHKIVSDVKGPTA